MWEDEDGSASAGASFLVLERDRQTPRQTIREAKREEDRLSETERQTER